MSDDRLRARRVLVAEDEYLIAMDAKRALQKAGATVLGPVATVRGALDLLDREEQVDGALLDVNLCGEKVFAVVDMLQSRGVPMILTTGYAAGDIPPAYRSIPRLEKPVGAAQVAEILNLAGGQA